SCSSHTCDSRRPQFQRSLVSSRWPYDLCRYRSRICELSGARPSRKAWSASPRLFRQRFARDQSQFLSQTPQSASRRSLKRKGAPRMSALPTESQKSAHLRLTLNGEEVDVSFAPYKTLLEVLREDLGHTGTKHGCELGECGACAVLLDGQPILSCLQ